ncbi:MAG: DUF1295 domain-containing protein [Saprospirales bacterium]|nr:DUF1295 domain-containing protein [Saprospirales bacterium]
MPTNTLIASKGRTAAFGWITLSYLLAIGAGYWAGQGFHQQHYHPLIVVGVADIVATLIIFGFSYVFKNSSFYDPYWSVIPVFIAAYLGWLGMESGANPLRLNLAFVLVFLWAFRLTGNWVRSWQGLQHEDWRYIQLAQQSGKAYWLVSFAGIHFFPTLMVLTGCFPLYQAMAIPNNPIGLLDFLGVLVTLTGIAFEFFSDNQRYKWAKDPANKGKVFTGGLWGWSRHPNYFGEVTFWIGLGILGLAADLSYWWTIIGCVAMWAMFHFITLPMMEKRQLANKQGYAEATKGVSKFFPRPPSSIAE